MKIRNKNISVTKASGNIELFSVVKLKSSLARAKATTDEINAVIETLLPTLYQGISTQKICSKSYSRKLC